jgi:hypothetical protein
MELLNERVNQIKKVQIEGLSLFTKKNQDYGDAFAKYGVVGVLVRIGDKIGRFQSVTAKQVSLVDTESLRDTLIDLHNYSAMAIMLMDEDMKKVKTSEKSENNSKGYLSTQNNNGSAQ